MLCWYRSKTEMYPSDFNHCDVGVAYTAWLKPQYLLWFLWCKLKNPMWISVRLTVWLDCDCWAHHSTDPGFLGTISRIKTIQLPYRVHVRSELTPHEMFVLLDPLQSLNIYKTSVFPFSDMVVCDFFTVDDQGMDRCWLKVTTQDGASKISVMKRKGGKKRES